MIQSEQRTCRKYGAEWRQRIGETQRNFSLHCARNRLKAQERFKETFGDDWYDILQEADARLASLRAQVKREKEPEKAFAVPHDANQTTDRFVIYKWRNETVLAIKEERRRASSWLGHGASAFEHRAEGGMADSILLASTTQHHITPLQLMLRAYVPLQYLCMRRFRHQGGVFSNVLKWWCGYEHSSSCWLL